MHSDDLQDARDNVAFMEAKYLREHGWAQSSNTPGSYVLWQRELDDGRTVLANQDLALAMTPWIIDEDEQLEGETRG